MSPGNTDVTGQDPVVLIPGLAMTARFFEPLVTRLPGHDVTVYELPGHGRNTAARARGLDDAVDGLGEHLRRHGERPVTLVGWSLGAGVAYSYLDRFGADRVARLVSVEMSPRLLAGEDWSLAAFGGLDAAGALAVLKRMWTEFDVFAAELVRACFAPDAVPDPALVATLAAESAACRAEDVIAVWTDALTRDWRPLLPAIDVPALVAHGTDSPIFPAGTGEWVAGALPRARLELIAGSGHMPFVERPEEFARALRAFLAEAPAAHRQPSGPA